MNLLRDRWRRTAVHQYFANLAVTDPLTFWVIVALLLAAVFSLSAIARAPATSEMFTAPPFELRFATADRAPS